MPRILSQTELAAIKRRNEKRTPGKWQEDGRAPSKDWALSIALIRAYPDDCDLICEVPYPDQPQHKANIAFIAHNSEDVPAMLQTIGALRGMLEHIRDMAAKAMPDSVYVNVASGLARRVLERMDA